MKTIKQAVEEYVNQERITRSEFTAFIDGVEFAQRWIPIEEDLPTSENYEYERCLWKNANGTIWFGSAYQSQKPTHWRPLERK